jgi:hypothetical protein
MPLLPSWVENKQTPFVLALILGFSIVGADFAAVPVSCCLRRRFSLISPCAPSCCSLQGVQEQEPVWMQQDWRANFRTCSHCIPAATWPIGCPTDAADGVCTPAEGFSQKANADGAALSWLDLGHGKL